MKQLTRAAVWELNIRLKRLAERLERRNAEREYERTLARVQDALNDRELQEAN
jgi:hypothetical protein